MPDDDPIPFYPTLRCHKAPLRPGMAPIDGCPCGICHWAARRSANQASLATAVGPIRPGTPAWNALLEVAAR